MKQFDAIIVGAGQAGPALTGRLTGAGMTGMARTVVENFDRRGCELALYRRANFNDQRVFAHTAGGSCMGGGVSASGISSPRFTR